MKYYKKEGVKLHKTIIKICILSILLMLCCTGCANVEYTMNINRDNSANIEYLMQIDETKISLKEYNSIIEEIINSLKENNFNVEKLDNGIKATKYIKNILEMSSFDSLLKEEDSNIFSYNEGIFTDKYELNGKIDLTGYSKSQKELKLDEEIKKIVNITLKIKLPTRVKHTNAQQISGDILTWNLEYGKSNEIIASYNLIKVEVIIEILVALVIFGLSFLLMKKFVFISPKC